VQRSTLRTAVSRDASGILAGENFRTGVSGEILEPIPEEQIFTASCSNTVPRTCTVVGCESLERLR